MKLSTHFIAWTGGLFIASLIGTGGYILYYSEINPSDGSGSTLNGWPKVIFGVHLFLWMVTGMASNYLWELFKTGKSWSDITWRGIIIPFLVSPIVFFSIWAIWKGEKIDFSYPLISFQSGFFWQVIFNRTMPASKPEQEWPNQPLQRNTGSRPLSDDLPVSQTPSSLGPRG